MDKYESVIDSIFLNNNGEVDLLTGAISPDRFDQIVKRDLAIAQRNSSDLSIISISLDLTLFFEKNQNQNIIELQGIIENELVSMHFNLKNIFRKSDCICRVSKLGFWVLLNGADKNTTDRLVKRLVDELPKFVKVGMCIWKIDESILDWYKRVDQIHFNNNQ
jgi:GGDEF domain-containing protein